MKKTAGIVQKGSQRAAALGYPTVNIPFEEVGADGIYAARVVLPGDVSRIAAAFVDGKKGILEAHILDFAGDLYGLPVEIELFEKIRSSGNYSDDESLKAAIAVDIAKVREFFKN